MVPGVLRQSPEYLGLCSLCVLNNIKMNEGLAYVFYFDQQIAVVRVKLSTPTFSYEEGHDWITMYYMELCGHLLLILQI